MRLASCVRCLSVLACVPGLAAQAQAPSRDVYAIVGARIEVGDGRVIEKGTVVLRDGMIEAVGADVKAPPEAEVIKGDGLVVYPGFIDGFNTSGLKLPDARPDQDTAPNTTDTPPTSMREANRKGVRPELRAAECLDLKDTLLAPLRKEGFTTALLMPAGGTINGCAALVNLSGLPKRDCVVRPDAGIGFSYRLQRGGFGGGGGYPGSLMGVIAHLRQTLLDARYFRTQQTAFSNGYPHRPPADDCLAALQPVLDARLPALFEADTENEIARALKMCDEFGMKLIVAGGTEAWKHAALLAKRQIPVVVDLNFEEAAGRGGRRGGPGRPQTPGSPPRTGRRTGRPGAPTQPNSSPSPLPDRKPDLKDLDPDEVPVLDKRSGADSGPEEEQMPQAVKDDQKKRRDEKVANAAKLHQAGVSFAFTTHGSKSPADFWTNLRSAIKAGLPKEAALRALTVVPARLYGVDRQMGTVEAGKTADLVVMSADFADSAAKVRYVFIDRSKFEPEKEARPTGGASLIPSGSGGPQGAETAAEEIEEDVKENVKEAGGQGA